MSEIVDTEVLLKEIVEAIQEKKGKEIVVADLTKLGNTICDYFVICSGNSPTQVSAIADSVEYLVRQNIKYRPIAVDGMRNAQWVAMDYGEVLVHIFLPEVREFYDIEHLWADAKLEMIPDLD